MYTQNTSITPNLSLDWLRQLDGYLGEDAYSTAWVAMVPALDNPDQPAWPSALDYLYQNQLGDGGWGDAEIYYAYERTISTLAGIQALDNWPNLNTHSQEVRIRRALKALTKYAKQLAGEPYAPVGFELLLPSFTRSLLQYQSKLPLYDWQTVVSPLYEKKLELLDNLEIDYTKSRAWWFSLEFLLPEKLAQIDEHILNEDGSIQTSVAATAAYLRAKRLFGQDVPQAAEFLERGLQLGQGGVPFSYPAENFERIWGADNFRRIGLHPKDPMLIPIVHAIEVAWHKDQAGLSSSNLFDVNDGDDTLLGFCVLNWAGMEVNDMPAIQFWQDDHFRSYMDESNASISANIHALEALRHQIGFPHYAYAEILTHWLKLNMGNDVPFWDKWHLSPLYTAAHALHASLGWDKDIADRCLGFILHQQHDDGGWGWFGKSTLEETAHCIIALGHVGKYQASNLGNSLQRAAQFMAYHNGDSPTERLWIGKTLFRPEGLLKSVLHSAEVVLVMLGYAKYLFTADLK